MKIVESEDSFELHILAAVTENIVTSNHKQYFYKRVVIPNILMNFFFEKKPAAKYVYLYFYENRVFLSVDKISEYKFSARKLMQFRNKNSFFINLNNNSLSKYNIHVSENVLFKVTNNSILNSKENISIELVF